ncbi:MAG: hypothetical protein GY862_32990 [Gammaproteobacteria bacterium]|nr:hypothetical protein [Gammaproteobacteria bacterium]
MVQPLNQGTSQFQQESSFSNDPLSHQAGAVTGWMSWLLAFGLKMREDLQLFLQAQNPVKIATTLQEAQVDQPVHGFSFGDYLYYSSDKFINDTLPAEIPGFPRLLK